MDPQPWPPQYIHVSRPAKVTVDLFEKEVQTAISEAPLQTLLSAHPEVLSTLMPPAFDRWSWDRPKFGNQFIPDFLLCHRNSKGFNWTMIELESPTERPLTKASLIAAKLNEAIKQVSEWRSWIRTNISYAHSTLKLDGLHAESPAIIVIGRRSMIDSKQAVRYNELSIDGKLEVMTYDRFIEMARAAEG